ncbi:dihydroneopterin aldolase [Tessaracoccus sp. OH4464_COT-324]|uniref:dihydroneopterin aldolase n=1 Tax=Tessaracoccus sp. OH4464_COT-324 TaxID=2491059 RepID=UPI0018F60D90|nr:dihydroneopterin aldolase [Tessaracoccus sp. OH4464_COT-324]
MDTITITGLRARGFHGVFDEERKTGQEFVVDVELSVPVLSATDELADTVNYAEVADLVIRNVQSGPYQLIETLAGVIADEILLTQPLAAAVRVRVHKPEAPIAHPFADVAVSITRSR